VLSDNFALLWLGISATTLATTFLVGFSGEPAALEAAWKYLVLCGTGIGFALLGIVMLAHVSLAAGVDAANALSWSAISQHAHGAVPELARAATAIMLIGFATKAGLAPMHAWLPDAHSKAPAPISALLSGVLVSCALYAIMRTLTVGTALGAGPLLHELLLWLGALSTLVAGTLMLTQSDLKRLLAYSTVEHAGIVALALGFGGPLGGFAALFHVVAHGFGKSAAFFAAGMVQGEHGTTELRGLRALWNESPSGRLLLGALTALCGMPPFGIFVSELLLVLAGVAAHAWVALGVGMLGIAFGFTAITRAAIQIESGHAKNPLPKSAERKPSWIATGASVLALGGALLVVVLPWSGLALRLQTAVSTILGGPP
jgi:hydrogenase-4 component F